MIGWKILIVDDDGELGSMLVQLMCAEGFSATHAAEGPAALKQISEQAFDLMILDIMMPHMDGIELLRRVRVESRLPILMLTARGDDNDRIHGLELGADDYLAKPFNPRELVARARAIIRRSSANPGSESPELILGPLAIDRCRMSARLHGEQVKLTSAEFMILEMLAQSSGRIQTRATLSCQALGRPLEAFDRSIDTHISNIRRKLLLPGDGSIDIKSSRGHGYVLTVSTARAS